MVKYELDPAHTNIGFTAKHLAVSTVHGHFAKFEGHYHGWLDNVLISNSPSLEAAGPADAPNAVPLSPGQATQLLKMVAVSGGRVPAEGAIEALWPEAGREAGRVGRPAGDGLLERGELSSPVQERRVFFAVVPGDGRVRQLAVKIMRAHVDAMTPETVEGP